MNFGIRASASLEVHTVLQGSSAGMGSGHSSDLLCPYSAKWKKKKSFFHYQFLQTTHHLPPSTIRSSHVNVFCSTRWRAHCRGTVLGVTGEKWCTVNKKKYLKVITAKQNAVTKSLCTQLKTLKNKHSPWKDWAHRNAKKWKTQSSVESSKFKLERCN